MRPCLSDVSDDVSSAKQQFKATVSQQRRLLVSGGLEASRASLQLMDQLIQHRLGSVASCSSDDTLADLQAIVSATGFAPAQAARTLLLKDEIAHLRSEGYSTADVIQELDHRLRAVTGLRRRTDENLMCMPKKKVKLSEEGLRPLTGPRPQADPCIWDAPAGRLLPDKRPREDMPSNAKADGTVPPPPHTSPHTRRRANDQ
jgi:hypothetical protein